MSRPIEITPARGGRLMSSLSAENAGIFNYVTKRDWRRYLDREIRAEGYDLFNPNPLVEAPEPPSGGEPITLNAQVRSPNGRTAFVVGTATTLWRYFGVENGEYYVEGVVEDGYFDDNPGVWVEIGSGFSSTGRRWEAVSVAGWLILNNGVDLPVAYRVEDMAVTPLYELREQGVASVGTISKLSDILLCGDIRQLDADKHVEIMSAIAGAIPMMQTGQFKSSVLATVNNGTPGVEGNTLIAESDDFDPGNGFTGREGETIRMANGLEREIVSVVSNVECVLDGEPDLAEPAQPFWLISSDQDPFYGSESADDVFPGIPYEDLVGRLVFWESGEVRRIEFMDGSTMRFDSDQAVPLGNVSLENPSAYAAFTDTNYIDRFHYRKLWALPGAPTRFAAVIPGTVTAGSHVLQLTYPVKSLSSGQEITITDAGENGEALRTTIIFAYPGTTKVLLLSDSALPGVLESITAALDAEAAAQLTVDNAEATLAAQQAALAAAQVESEADPDDATKKQAVADASAKVDAAQAALSAAQVALTAATAARVEAEAQETTVETLLTATDAVGSIAGFEDLTGDGSGILKMLELRGYIVIYKETGIFIGRFTGATARPFEYEELDVPVATALYHPDTLILVNGGYHLYASKDSFYRFDLATRHPQVFEPFAACRDKFFDALDIKPLLGPEVGGEIAVGGAEVFEELTGLTPGAEYELTYESGEVVRVQASAEGEYTVFPPPGWTPQEDPEDEELFLPIKFSFRQVLGSNSSLVFAADNAVTKEIFVCFPSTTDDKVLRFDYETGTASTSGAAYSAAATIQRPTSKVQVGVNEQWFVMGTDGGKVLRYGRIAGNPIPSGAVKATTSGQVATTTSTFFTPEMVGRTLKFSGGKCAAVTAYTDPTHVTLMGDVAGITSQAFIVLPAIWHRDGDPYDSVFESGLEAFGTASSEKQWTEYVPILASQQSTNTPLTLSFIGGANPSGAAVLASTTLNRPLTQNLVTLILLQHYLADRVTVSGKNNPCELASRHLRVDGVDSRHFNRRTP